MTSLKKAMLLLSMGGVAFFFFGGGLLDPSGMGCIRNSDLTTFYQGAGDAAIAEFVDTTRNTMPYPVGGDFDNIVVTPTADFVTSLFNNWIAQQIPLDLDPRTSFIKQ